MTKLKHVLSMSGALLLVSTAALAGPSRTHSHRKGSLAPTAPLKREIIPGLNKALLKATAELTPPAAEAPFKFQTSFSPEQINSCIESVCGPATGNLSAYDILDTRKTETVQFKELWSQKAEPGIRRLLLKEQRTEQLFIQRITQFLGEKRSLDTNHLGRAMITYMKALRTLSPVITEISDFSMASMHNIKLVDEKFQKQFANRTPEEREVLYLIAKDVFLPFFSKSLMKQMVNYREELHERLTSRYPGVASNIALKKDAEKIWAKWIIIQNTYGLMSTEDDVLLKKALETGELNASESDQYMELLANFEMIGYAFDPDVLPRLMKLPFDPKESLSRLANIPLQQIQASDSKLLEERITTIQKTCRAKLAQADGVSISRLVLRRADENIRRMKAAAIRVISRMADPSAVPYLAKMVEETRFQLPQAGPTASLQLLKSMSRRESAAEQTLRDLGSNSNEAFQRLMYKAILEIEQNEPGKAFVSSLEEDNINNLCNSIEVSSLTDAAMTSAGQINVSWFSVNFPQVGLGVLAHELGHVMSPRLMFLTAALGGNYDDIRQCVKERNPFFEPTLGNLIADSLWTEEDWADTFATLVLRELAKEDAGQSLRHNFSCALVLDLGDTYMMNTMNPRKNDTHSSGFLRLLMTSNDLKKTTPACAPFMKAVADAGHPLNCDKPDYQKK